MQTADQPDHSARDEARSGPSMAPLRLVTLGTFKLLWRTPDGTLSDITYPFYQALNGRGPSVQLLKVLVCLGHPPRLCHEASRDALIEAIWRERAERINVELALNAAKSDLCRTLFPYAGADVLYTLGGPDRSGRGYGLAAPLLDIDADAFERAVAQTAAATGLSDPARLRALWQAAYALAPGEFLPLDLYQDWTRERRERIAASTRLCLHRLAALSENESEWLQASARLHPYVLSHPQDYETLCLAVSLLSRQARHQDALDLCAHMRRALEAEEEEVPAELVALEKQLRRKLRTACLTQLKCASVAVSLTEPPTLSSSRAPGLVSPHSPLPAQTSGQGASWFDLTLKRMRVLIAAWRGRALYCEELQAILDQEFAMTDVVRSLFEDFAVSRRKALLALAALSADLLLAVREEPTSHKLLEQFLPQCAASLTACQHLMRGSDFWTAEKALKQYMPVLEYVAQKPSLYQQAAARLAAQGRMMLSLLAWHHMDADGRIQHLEKAATFSLLIDDRNIQVSMLSALGITYSELKRPDQAMQVYQEALQYEKALSPLVRSSLYSRIAFASAQLGQTSEARSYLDAAQNIFPDHPADDPGSLFAHDASRATLYLFGGWTYFALSQAQDPDEPPNRAYLEQTWNAYQDALTNPDALLSERVRIEIVNHQAAAAIAQRDLEKFQHYFLEGVRGAKALNSQKRKQEAIENWKAATKVWSSEPQIIELAEELMGQ